MYQLPDPPSSGLDVFPMEGYRRSLTQCTVLVAPVSPIDKF